MGEGNTSGMATNLSSNQTSEMDRLKLLYYPIIIPPILFLCLLSILANGIILLSVRWLHRTPSPLLMLTISLCVADFWLGIQQSVNFVLEGYLPHVLGIKVHQAPCQDLMMEAVRCGALITSVLHLFALASNHYIGIVRPLHYKNMMTPEVTYAIICFIWFLPTVSLIIFFGLKSNDGFINIKCNRTNFYFDFSFRLVIGSIFIIPLILMFFIYAHIGVLLIRRRQNPYLSAHMPAKQLRRNLKAATTTTLYLGTFTVFWMPSVILSLLICPHGCPIEASSFVAEHPAVLLVIGSVMQVSVVLKALCDAAIYAARVREIQFAICTMHARLCCGPWSMCKSFDESKFRSSFYHGGPSSIANSRSMIDRERARSFAASSPTSPHSRQIASRTYRFRYWSLPDSDQLNEQADRETDNLMIECRTVRSRRSPDHHPHECRKVSLRIPPVVNEETLRELDNETSAISSEDLCSVVKIDSSSESGTPGFVVVSGFTLPLTDNAVYL
uniref:G-protein coupled receptors family 1 profile domain-containing protein n=1 Tax=Plectus sambesii TaxID=2011161 RepID=A0A914WYU9_9BILA